MSHQTLGDLLHEALTSDPANLPQKLVPLQKRCEEKWLTFLEAHPRVIVVSQATMLFLRAVSPQAHSNILTPRYCFDIDEPGAKTKAVLTAHSDLERWVKNWEDYNSNQLLFIEMPKVYAEREAYAGWMFLGTHALPLEIGKDVKSTGAPACSPSLSVVVGPQCVGTGPDGVST
jgi:hypothetical protein